MIQINDKTKCCGCTACMSACPENCISMEEDYEGFLYPIVDTAICVNCGLCEKVCPISNTKGEEACNSLFIGIQNLNEEKRLASTAGGGFSLIADYLIDQGATVFAVGYDNNAVVCHKKATDKNEIADLRGSKYVQSNIGDTFCCIKRLLKSNGKVLFVGTPCQVHGLINFVGLNDNLYTMDLLCLGVSSPKLFAEYIAYLNKKYKSNVYRVEFRNKYFGYSTPNVRVCFSNGHYIQQKYDSKCYANLFFQKHYNNRPCCYECGFREIPRVSDFTVGDFVSIGKYDKSMDDDKGTTRLWVHSVKGKQVLEKVSNKKVRYISDSESNIIGGAKKQIPYPSKRDEFFKDAREMDFFEFVAKWQPPTAKDYVAGFIRYFLHYAPFGTQVSKYLRKLQAERFDKNVKNSE